MDVAVIFTIKMLQHRKPVSKIFIQLAVMYLTLRVSVDATMRYSHHS